MENELLEDCRTVTNVDSSRERNRKDAVANALDRLREIRLRKEHFQENAALKSAHHATKTNTKQETDTIRNDRVEPSPRENRTSSLWTSLQAWARQAGNMFSDISLCKSSLWSYLWTNSEQSASNRSNCSTSNSKLEGNIVEQRKDGGNGQYAKFVETLDEYQHVDEREADSSDNGEELEEYLGGEIWDKTL